MCFLQSGLTVIVFLCCFAVDVRAELPLAVQTPAETKVQLQKKTLGSVRNVHVLGDIYLAGQPTPADLALLKQQGFKTIISLRHTGEIPWDEAAAVEHQGMKFVHIPFQKPEELQAKVFDKVLKVLRDKKRGPTLLHCGSANRVGAIWYAHRVLDGKLSDEAALKEAKTVGLRTPEFLEKARQYASERRITEEFGRR